MAGYAQHLQELQRALDRLRDNLPQESSTPPAAQSLQFPENRYLQYSPAQYAASTQSSPSYSPLNTEFPNNSLAPYSSSDSASQYSQPSLHQYSQRVSGSNLNPINEDEPLVLVRDSGKARITELAEYDPRSVVVPLAIAPILIPTAPLEGPNKVKKHLKLHFKKSRARRVLMDFFKTLRSRSKLKDGEDNSQALSISANGLLAPSDPLAVDFISKLDATILRRIFGFVAPHTRDTSYDECETSLSMLTEYDCSLCDLRQLSYCTRVQRSWYEPASRQLYRTILIYETHWPKGCYPEEAAAKRQKKAAKTPANDNLESKYSEKRDHLVVMAKLLTNALRENPSLAAVVEYIKLAYNFREYHRGHTARLAQTCPNVRFVDVGDSFYQASQDTELLRSELEVNCSRLSMMKFSKGSAGYFHRLANRNPWKFLETLTLEDIKVDQQTFRKVIAALPALYKLVLHSLEGVSDEVFTVAAGVPDFPAIPEIEFHDMPEITAAGLVKYLSGHVASPAVKTLTLRYTGVEIETLHYLLAATSRLRSLTIIDRVEKPLPLKQPPIIRSSSLQTLHYEIKEDAYDAPVAHPAESYHAYLANSILGGGLPELVTIYTLDQQMVFRLNTTSLAHPRSNRVEGPSRELVSSMAPDTMSLDHALEIYLMAGRGWDFSTIKRDAEYNDTIIPRERPISSFNASMSTRAHRRIMAPNGSGGYQLVPPDPNPRSSSVDDRHAVRTAICPDIPEPPVKVRRSWVPRPASSSDLWR